MQFVNEDLTLLPEHMRMRFAAWRSAEELVKEPIDEHGLETYSVGNIFNVTSTFTAVDQHIDHILRVANWLLGED